MEIYAADIRESVGAVGTDTPRCEPQVCSEAGGRENMAASGSAAHVTPQVSVAASVTDIASHLPLAADVFQADVTVSYIQTQTMS